MLSIHGKVTLLATVSSSVQWGASASPDILEFIEANNVLVCLSVKGDLPLISCLHFRDRIQSVWIRIILTESPGNSAQIGWSKIIFWLKGLKKSRVLASGMAESRCPTDGIVTQSLCLWSLLSSRLTCALRQPLPTWWWRWPPVGSDVYPTISATLAEREHFLCRCSSKSLMAEFHWLSLSHMLTPEPLWLTILGTCAHLGVERRISPIQTSPSKRGRGAAQEMGPQSQRNGEWALSRCEEWMSAFRARLGSYGWILWSSSGAVYGFHFYSPGMLGPDKSSDLMHLLPNSAFYRWENWSLRRWGPFAQSPWVWNI